MPNSIYRYGPAPNIMWIFKILVKLTLSLLPLKYSFWKTIGIFKHGDMRHFTYSQNVFNRHFERYSSSTSFKPDFDILEIGPGDSANTMIFAKHAGANSVTLIDDGQFIDTSITSYQRIAENISLETAGLNKIKDFENLLKHYNTEYHSNGLVSLREIKSNSFDFIFSQAVFEHIKRSEFEEYLVELKRVLRPNGMMSHRIDFKDHLGGGLNNLRFSEKIWESSLFFKSGFYTNRFRFKDIETMMKDTNFHCSLINVSSWETLPIHRKRLAQEFSHYTDHQLIISGVDIVCTHIN